MDLAYLPASGSAAHNPTTKTVLTVLRHPSGDRTMPKLVHTTPKYRRHKASGQAVVTLDGKDHSWASTGPKPAKLNTTDSSANGSLADGRGRLTTRRQI
jgi:hypothetical protein